MENIPGPSVSIALPLQLQISPTTSGPYHQPQAASYPADHLKDHQIATLYQGGDGSKTPQNYHHLSAAAAAAGPSQVLDGTVAQLVESSLPSAAMVAHHESESPLNLHQQEQSTQCENNTSLKATGDLLEQAMAQLNNDQGDTHHTVERNIA